MSITLRDVTKIYEGSSGLVEAVTTVSLNIRDGEFVSILGPSGCGKSTLLMMMAGLELSSSGAIVVDDVEITGPRRSFGLVFQDPTLLPWLTAEDNVLFPIKMMQLNMHDYRERARDLLASVGLSHFVKSRPRELSGGMRQRVALCRSLIHRPTTLFMDEPFSALDAITRDDMGQVLLDLWDDGRETLVKTGVFVTHSIREAVLLSDRVVVMGRRPSVVKADVKVPFARPRSLRTQETAEFNEIVAELRQYIDHGP